MSGSHDDDGDDFLKKSTVKLQLYCIVMNCTLPGIENTDKQYDNWYDDVVTKCLEFWRRGGGCCRGGGEAGACFVLRHNADGLRIAVRI